MTTQNDINELRALTTELVLSRDARPVTRLIFNNLPDLLAAWDEREKLCEENVRLRDKILVDHVLSQHDIERLKALTRTGPTEWAYKQACKALHNKTESLNSANAEIERHKSLIETLKTHLLRVMGEHYHGSDSVNTTVALLLGKPLEHWLILDREHDKAIALAERYRYLCAAMMERESAEGFEKWIHDEFLRLASEQQESGG